MWPFKSSDSSAARSGEARDELRAPLEAHPGRRRAACPRAPTARARSARSRRRPRASRPARYSWSAVLLPRRVVRLPGGRVEADQVGCEPDELLRVRRDRSHRTDSAARGRVSGTARTIYRSVGSAPVRAAVLYEFNEPLVVEEVELDAPKEGEIAIRMAASGVCHSDLHVVQNIHPTAAAGHPRPRGRGRRRGDRAGSHERRARRSRHARPGFPTAVAAASARAAGRTSARTSPGTTRRSRTEPTRFHIGDRRIHHYNTSSFAERSVVPARTAIPGRSDAAAHRARAHGLRGHDRSRRRAQHGPRAAGRVGRGRRLRRRGAERDPGRRNRRCADDRRRRCRTRRSSRRRGRSARPTPSMAPPSMQPKPSMT